MNAGITLPTGSGSDYLGLGPSAFSTIGKRRWQNTPDTSRYIEQLQAGIEPIHFREIITGQIRKPEAIAFGLRTSVGVLESSMAGVDRRIGCAPERRLPRKGKCTRSIDRERPDGR